MVLTALFTRRRVFLALLYLFVRVRLEGNKMVGASAFACYKRVAIAGVELFELEALIVAVVFEFLFVGTSRRCDACHGAPNSIRRHGFDWQRILGKKKNRLRSCDSTY